MPPVHIQPGGLLDEVHNIWRTRGWDLDGLRRFRMGPDEDALAALDEDELADLQTLTDADVTALRALTPEQLAELDDDNGDDNLADRLHAANQESAKRRRELKPWKDLAKELGMTPDEIRAAVKKAAGKPKGKKADDDGGEDEVDVDEVKRQSRAEADAVANRRIVRAEVKVLARDIFADPDDAPLYVDVDDWEVDDDGDIVDKDDLVAELKKIVKSKPHLAKKAAPAKKDKSQGERDHDAKPSVARGKEMFEARKPKKAS